MAFNIIKCSLGLVVCLDAAVLFIRHASRTNILDMDACQNSFIFFLW